MAGFPTLALLQNTLLDGSVLIIHGGCGGRGGEEVSLERVGKPVQTEDDYSVEDLGIVDDVASFFLAVDISHVGCRIEDGNVLSEGFEGGVGWREDFFLE